jgi:cobalt-zinc-cadmium efflux system outer membrane protein
MLSDRTPMDRFDLAGSFDFSEKAPPLEDLRTTAQDVRPDLRAAAQAVRKAETDHRLAIANASTDPTFGVDIGRNPPLSIYVGGSVNIPLRINDRNQGEKLRTEIEIAHSQKLLSAAQNQVFSDVDSAYYTVLSTVSLLRPYRDKYLKEAGEVRDTIEFSYTHGQAALVDFLDAQRDYRAIQVNYLNLIGSYLTAAGQLNMAVGREVIQ